MYNENELVPISRVSHFVYCERRYALVHLEQMWQENVYTAEGRVLHERVDFKHRESRRSQLTEYSLPIRSLEYGLIGVADVVELERSEHGGYATIRPVEFKRGRKKPNDVDRVQLCAQALCLEEMFSVSIPEGQFYYLQEHRRTTVQIDEELRSRTIRLVTHIHDLLASQITPAAVYEKTKCDRCSLIELCMPKSVNHGGKEVARYVSNQLRNQMKADNP